MSNQDHRRHHIEQWLYALRSGHYRQGRSALRTTKGEFCCLGVACDQYQRATGNGRWKGSEFVVGEAGDANYLPEVVQEWLGLYDHKGLLRTEETLLLNGDAQDRFCNDGLAGLNDSGKFTFAQIADFIETHLEKMVKEGV